MLVLDVLPFGTNTGLEKMVIRLDGELGGLSNVVLKNFKLALSDTRSMKSRAEWCIGILHCTDGQHTGMMQLT